MTGPRRLLGLFCAALTASAAIIASGGAPAAFAAAPVSKVTPVPGPVPAYATQEASARITARDGVVLAAKIYSPAGATGMRPLIILPSAWGGESGQLAWSGKQLAARGFVVVNYATRGFQDSGGEVSLAGPKDITDVSDLIDWSIAHEPVDGTRVGMWGLSYGAGLSLLAAAYEPRLDAVGSLEGFSDLVRTAYPNRTRSTVLVAGLWFGALVSGRLDAPTIAAFQSIISGNDMRTTIPYLQSRSPLDVVDRINRNGTAVLMASSWNDIAYGTDQVTDLYTRLTGPKRLELRPGDHVVNEVPGSIGVGDPTMYNHLFDWLTTYVGGIDTPLVHQPAVWMQPRSSVTPPAPETYPSWPAVTTGTRSFGLTGQTGWIQPTGGLTTSTPGTPSSRVWSQTISDGTNVVSGLGAPVLNFAGEALDGVPPKDLLGLVDRANTSIWKGPALTAPLALRGQTTVRITLTPNRSAGTVVVYLYDANGDDGYVISHRPYSFSGVTPGRPIQLTLPLQPTAYTLPTGHRLALGISTGDPLYADENPAGAKITLSSSAASPASLTVSTGR